MIPRPRSLDGKTVKLRTGCGALFVTVNFDKDKKIREVFAYLGKSGSCFSSQVNSLCRMISVALRNDVPIEDITDHLKGQRCPTPSIDEGIECLSCSDAIAKAMEIVAQDLKEGVQNGNM